jgi:hypothetical protein
MVITKSKACKKGLIGITLFLSIVMFIGCLTTRSAEIHNTSGTLEKSQFTGKTIAVLPVKETQVQMTGAGSESTVSLRIAINDKIDSKVIALMPNSKIIKYKTVTKALNDESKLSLIDDLAKTYENTGTYDNKSVNSICDVLKADFIVVGKLKAGKTDMSIIAKGMVATLEVSIISKQTKEVVWGGSGNYKKGGMMGFGGVDDKGAAEELVNLAFSTYK